MLTMRPGPSIFPRPLSFPERHRKSPTFCGWPIPTGFQWFPEGAGSGFSGGALPVAGGLVMAMNRFNRIRSIDTDNLVVEVEPAVVTAHLQAAVEKKGLFYPPDPASYTFSTIGGNIAENSGGMRAVKYGVTRDYVRGLEVVLPVGRGDPHRFGLRQGRRRLRSDHPVRGLGRHFGRGHPGHPAAAAPSRSQTDPDGRLSDPWPRLLTYGIGCHRPGHRSHHPRISGRPVAARPWSAMPPSVCPKKRRPFC